MRLRLRRHACLVGGPWKGSVRDAVVPAATPWAGVPARSMPVATVPARVDVPADGADCGAAGVPG
ncbi:hypothetical protein GCM10020001_046420 [Nonomuraea salmonea]